MGVVEGVAMNRDKNNLSAFFFDGSSIQPKSASAMKMTQERIEIKSVWYGFLSISESRPLQAAVTRMSTAILLIVGMYGLH